jgi:hypothetical protein
MGPVLVCVGLIWHTFLPIQHYNPITGMYTYNPRVDEPSSWVLENRPETVLVDEILPRILENGTYPASARSLLVDVEAMRVRLNLRTDWQVVAHVTTWLHYADGTTQPHEFSFHSMNASSTDNPLFLVAFHAKYGASSSVRCSPDPGTPGVSYCNL